jgi:hypothetical protein
MDLSAILITAAVVSIIANFLKVWQFGSSCVVAYIKNPKSTRGPF